MIDLRIRKSTSKCRKTCTWTLSMKDCQCWRHSLRRSELLGSLFMVSSPMIRSMNEKGHRNCVILVLTTKRLKRDEINLSRTQSLKTYRFCVIHMGTQHREMTLKIFNLWAKWLKSGRQKLKSPNLKVESTSIRGSGWHAKRLTSGRISGSVTLTKTVNFQKLNASFFHHKRK